MIPGLPIDSVGRSKSKTVTSLAITGASGSISMTLQSSNGTPLTVDWGDGSRSTHASNTTASHTYGTSFTGAVRIIPTGSARLTYLDSGAPWSFHMSALPRGMTYVKCYSASGTMTGDLKDLPRTLTTCQISGTNTIAGNLSSLPSGLTYFNCVGSNTIAGNLSSLPSGLTSFTCTGSNTLTGNLSSLPAGLTAFSCWGSNTVTGDLATLPTGLTYFSCGGSNTVTGDLSSLPPGVVLCDIYGNNTVTFTGSWYRTSMRQVRIRGASYLSTTVTDAILNALAATVTSWIAEKVVNIKGTRTAASDAAVTTLTGLGVTVTVN